MDESSMQVTRFRDPESFRARAGTFLLRAEAQNNLLLSVSARMGAVGEDAYLVTVEDGGAVVACALRTPPNKAVISRAAPDAIACLVADLSAKYPDLPDVLGPEPDVTDLANLWAERTGLASVRGSRQRLFEIRQGPRRIETGPAGRLRIAEHRDLPTAVAWCAAFIAEAIPGAPTDPRSHASARIAERSLFFWDDCGPVSMAGWAGETARGVRVNFVYTPHEHRARGYATACVASLTQRLLDEGRTFCCLYTDLSNPTSNSIYQKIGYRPVCDWSDYTLNLPKACSVR